MNKKLICLTLSILMLLTCLLTSCGQDDKDKDALPGEGETVVDNSAKTITLWVIADDLTLAENNAAADRVEKAFTKITKAKFKTNVDIQFCSEADYYEKLEAAIENEQKYAEMEEAAAKKLRQYLKKNKDSGKDTATLTDEFYELYPEYEEFRVSADEASTGENVEETETNEYGISEIQYPATKKNQVDIFYLSGYDKYMEYYENEWLASLTEELGTSSQKLTDYISSSLLNGVQIEGSVYAIPNNVAIGEYTYMMVDKALFDSYYQKIDKVNTVLDLKSFLGYVQADNAGKTAEDAGYVVPLASTYEECLKMLCWYWDIGYTDRSCYQMHYDEASGRYYVVKEQYTVELVDLDKDGNEVPRTETRNTNVVLSDGAYKVNADGQFLCKDGQYRTFTFKSDENIAYEINKRGDVVKSETLKGGLYLVDENGDPVTFHSPEEDPRVLDETYETKTDSDGKVRPTYHYTINDDASFSILGTMMKNAEKRDRGDINMDFNSLFTDANYRELYATLKDYEMQNYYGEAKDGQIAAVSFRKGDSTIKMESEKNKSENEKYGTYIDENGREYYVIIAEYPEATDAELYGNMFAVYANSANVSRAMRIVTYLNTNAELRNLFQYGILGEHYELNENGTVHQLSTKNNTYRMDLEKTGNCFIAYPDETMAPDVWEKVKQQNNDSLINPLLGFDFNAATADSDYALDIKLIDHIAELNEDALIRINACTNRKELEEVMHGGSDSFSKIYAVTADALLQKACDGAYDPETDKGAESARSSSPAAVYRAWQKAYGYFCQDVPANQD